MKKIALACLILILLLPAAGYLFLRSYLPDYAMQMKVSGLTAAVSIERNRFAVPTIRAEHLDDLYFAWGYVNALDRMFQMEITRRIGQGRISEFAGETALSKDVFLRSLGFYEMAQREADALPAGVKRILQRFVDGINYFLETERTPLYFALLGIEKEPWTLADPLVIGHMLNWTLTNNLNQELMNHQITERIGLEKARQLLNCLPTGTPTITAAPGKHGKRAGRMPSAVGDLGALMGGLSASNNFTLAPGKTAHRGALLANAPHVHGSKIPSDFYLIRVMCDDFRVTGGQVAGLPFVAFGYNDHVAWGITNQGADMVDVYFETVDWARKTYAFDGEQIPLNAQEIEIGVKGQPAKRMVIYSAGGRPILDGVFTDIDATLSVDYALFDGRGFLEGFLDLNRARNHDDFIRAVDKIQMSPQNMVYADAQGEIAYRTIGMLVKRKPGTGNFPNDGSRVRRNWSGPVAAADNPSSLNDGRGFIITANNRVCADFPYDMNGTFAPRYRYEAIERMLTGKTDIDMAYVERMQCDTHSVLAARMIPLAKKYVPDDGPPLVRQARDVLVQWDGDVRVDRPEPSIYNTWLLRFMYQTYVDELGAELAATYVSQRYVSLERFLMLLEADSPFSTTPGPHGSANPSRISPNALSKRPSRCCANAPGVNGSPTGNGAGCIRCASIIFWGDRSCWHRSSTAGRCRWPATAKPT
jgi:penicillin amidase